MQLSYLNQPTVKRAMDYAYFYALKYPIVIGYSRHHFWIPEGVLVCI
ncbi:hypothetical protein ACU8DI_06795 [Psychroserpens sp. BH13MA-6]